MKSSDWRQADTIGNAAKTKPERRRVGSAMWAAKPLEKEGGDMELRL